MRKGLVLALLLTGCKPKPKEQPPAPTEETPAQTSPAETVETPKAEPAKPPPPGPQAIAKNKAVRLLRRDTKPTEEVLAALLEECDVEAKSELQDEGSREANVFHVSHDGAPLMRIYPGETTLGTVRILDKDVVFAGTTHRIGQPISTTQDITSCGCQGEDGVDGFVCALSVDRLAIVLTAKDGDCGLPVRPPDEALLNRLVQAYEWQP